MSDFECNPEEEFCDSEIPLNDINQEYDPEGLKMIGYTALIKLILPAVISGEMIEAHMEANEIEPFSYLANKARYLARSASKLSAFWSAKATEKKTSPKVRQDDSDDDDDDDDDDSY